MRTNRTILIILSIIILGGVGFFVWKLLRPVRYTVTPPPEEQTIPYYLFTPTDTPTTTVTIGGTVIVQLPATDFGEPHTLVDAVGLSLPATVQTYGEYYLVSWNIPTTTSLEFSAHNLKGKEDYTLSLKATTTRSQ